MSSEQRPRPRRALLALASLRSRVRALFLVDGLVALAQTVCLSVAVTFLVDYTLRLPRGVRGVLVLGVIAFVTTIIVKRLLRPRRLRVPLEELASLVERENPELKQALVTAVQLTSPSNTSSRYLSTAMIDSVVADVERRLSGVSLNRVLRLGGIARSLAAFLLLGVLILWGATARGDLAGIWYQRICLLGDVDWPKRVQLALVRPVDNPANLALGEELVVEVRAERGHPSQVEIRHWNVDGRSGDVRIEYMEEMPDRRYRFAFRNRSRPFVFQIRGGDDKLPPVEVNVHIRPRIAGVKLWCTYPEYTGKPATPADQPIEHGHLEVPVGTEVRMEALTNVEVEGAYFRFVSTEDARAEAERAATSTGGPPPADVWPPSGAGHLEELAIEPVAPGTESGGDAEDANEPTDAEASFARSRLRVTLRVEKEGRSQFHLLGTKGLQNSRPVVFRVRAIADRAPIVNVREPTSENADVSPVAKIPVVVDVKDDYGIKDGALKGVLFGFEDGNEIERPIELPLEDLAAASPEKASKKVRAELTLDVAALGAQTGWRGRFHIESNDFGGNVGESSHFDIRVVDKEEIMRLVQGQLMIVRDQVESIQRQQESSRKDLDDFYSQVSLQKELDRKSAGKLARHRQNQERVTRGLTRATNLMTGILERMAQNDVGERKDKEWMGRIADELAALAEDDSPAVEDDLTKLRADTESGPQSPDRIPGIMDRQKRIEKDLGDLSLRLTEYGDVNSIIQRWRDILRRQMRIRDQVHDAVRGSGADDL